MWGTYYGFAQLEIIKKKELSSSNNSISSISSVSSGSSTNSNDSKSN